MKVAIIGSKDFDSLEYHLSDSLRFLGKDVCHFDIGDIVPVSYRWNYYICKFLSMYDEFLFKKLAHRVIEVKPDLVICTYRWINPICIRIIKSALISTKVIHINPDAVTTFEYQQVFASPYDAFFTKDKFILSFMKDKMRLNAFYLPEAFNPRLHKKPNVERIQHEISTNIDVLSFGSMYPYRANMIKYLSNRGVVFSLYGVPDKRYGSDEINKFFMNEFITGTRKAELLYGAKIVFNNFHYAEVEAANVKFFEIFGIGGFQICDYKPILKEYTEIDLEKFTFKSIDEAYDLIEFYLRNPQLRYELADEQYDYFKNNHTYDHRLSELINLL